MPVEAKLVRIGQKIDFFVGFLPKLREALGKLWGALWCEALSLTAKTDVRKILKLRIALVKFVIGSCSFCLSLLT